MEFDWQTSKLGAERAGLAMERQYNKAYYGARVGGATKAIHGGLATTLGFTNSSLEHGWFNPGTAAKGAYSTFKEPHVLATMSRGAQWGWHSAAGKQLMGMEGRLMSTGKGLWAGTNGTALFNMALMAEALHSGYKEGGVVGAFKGGAQQAAFMGVAEAVQVGAQNAGMGYFPYMGRVAAGAARTASMVVLPAVMASMGVAFATSQVSKFAMAKHQKLPLQVSGDLAAFNTRAATTMRQRSVQSIQKSHLGARNSLGSESQLYHYSGYRAF